MDIGIDMSQISEFHRILESEKYKKFLFTENELQCIEDCSFNKQLESLAGKFCAKEAIVKALGTGFLTEDMVKWKDVEILKDKKGNPFAILHDNAWFIFKTNHYSHVRLTITHKKDHAISFALLY